MKTLFKLSLIIFLLLPAAVFASSEITVMTYDSFSVSSELVEAFETENDIKIHFIQAGNGGEMISRAVLTKDAPIADVIIGFDDSQLEKVFENDILEPYQAPALASIPEAYQLDPEFRALPFNFGDVCINYDVNWFEENQLVLPSSLEDLAKPEYAGLLVTEDPSASNTGMAFLLATIAQFGEDGYIPYWQSLIENGMEITNDWSTAYYTNFSGSAGMGPQPMVVSYTSSPAAEVLYAETELDQAPTASLTAPGMCYRPIEFCGILKNSKNIEAARKFVDAFLGKTWQEDLPLQMFVYPVCSEAELPEAFTLYGAPAEDPAQLDNALVIANRNKWVQEWTDQVLSKY